jgi:hypothetical protein
MIILSLKQFVQQIPAKSMSTFSYRSTYGCFSQDLYSHGNNVGNVHFLWKVTGSSHSEDISQSQPTIEKAKEETPVYHTRAMRRAS